MEITKREIIISVALAAILFVIGLSISNIFSDKLNEEMAKYNKALKINDDKLFQYALRTNVGDAIVSGTMTSIDPIEYPDIKGKFMYIKKVDEEYVQKTRTVTKTDSKGKTYTETETYYEWDTIKSESKSAKKVRFNGVEFNSNQFNTTNDYLDTVYKDSDNRSIYFGTPSEIKGAFFTNISNHNIGTDNNFFRDYDIQAVIDRQESKGILVIFWVVWILIMVMCIYGFCTLENNWLE